MVCLCPPIFSQQATAEKTESNAELLTSKAFRAAAKKIAPSLVSIETIGGVAPAAGSTAAGAIGRPGERPTTGVIISPDGCIATSTFNFLDRPPVITAVTADGRRRVARLVGSDQTRKICLLKIDGVADLTVPEMVPQKDLSVGQWAVALGLGFGGREPALSAGIVSALGRISGRAVQTDANISPVNYGGPLIDLRGRMIGICVPLAPQSNDVEAGVQWYDSGIGFAIPLAGAEKWLAQLRAGRTLEAAYLGLAARAPAATELGVIVEQVAADSPAAIAGLLPGDAVLSIDGQTVLDPVHLRTVVARYVAGDEVTIVLRRGEEELRCQVALGTTPPPPAEPRQATTR